MWIKFCGICRPEDFQIAVELGVDALGLIIVPLSPRCLSETDLRTLSSLRRGHTKLVLVMQDPSPELISRVIDIVKPDLLQFHGNESPHDCMKYELPYIKACRAGVEADLLALNDHTNAWAWLIDRRPNAHIDQAVDRLREQCPAQRTIEAGGLTTENVAHRIRASSPFGVDVSSGIESEPRVKVKLKMEQFARATRHAFNDKL